MQVLVAAAFPSRRFFFKRSENRLELLRCC